MTSHFPSVEILISSIQYHSDPLGLYQHLCNDEPNSLLLESAEIRTKNHLKSIIMPKAALLIRCDGYTLTFKALSKNGQSLLAPITAYFTNSSKFNCKAHLTDKQQARIELLPNRDILDEDERLKTSSPLDGLRLLINELKSTDNDDLEHVFLGGILAYDLIETIEPLPKVDNADNHCPDYLFYLAESLIVIDHQLKLSEVISLNFSSDNQITTELKTQTEHLITKAEETPVTSQLVPLSNAEQKKLTTDVSDNQFCDTVSKLKQEIINGNIFQVVPSRSFSIPCPNSIGAYRALKQTNPSPYMFYFRGPDFVLFGASPESAIKYNSENRQVEVYPIAGTRPRGKDETGNIDIDLDSRIELELRLDKKELSEHLMLVDLARNDIARIAESGTRNVAELLKVDRYSHVMHLVSRVTGKLKMELDALHAYQACMNMGTLVGAPKIRAAQLIRQVEQKRRGSYGGAVGYLNALGDMDTCIVIRSAFVTNDVAHIQAGAGVVFDSNPQAEANETKQKAQAVINAVKIGGGV